MNKNIMRMIDNKLQIHNSSLQEAFDVYSRIVERKAQPIIRDIENEIKSALFGGESQVLIKLHPDHAIQENITSHFRKLGFYVNNIENGDGYYKIFWYAGSVHFGDRSGLDEW